MNMKNLLLFLVALLPAALLSGCSLLPGRITGEVYPDAQQYQCGNFSYQADEVHTVRLHWRSGAVEIVESDKSELTVRESGDALSQEESMHYRIENGILDIYFCASGASLRLRPTDKHLALQVPQGISLSVSTTSAPVQTAALHQKDILLAAFSGGLQLGRVEAEQLDLSTSSGTIQAEHIAAQQLSCASTSGAVELAAAAEEMKVTTSSSSVRLALTAPTDASIRTSSADVQLQLPDTGAQLAFSGSSGRLRTQLPFSRKGDLYVFGSGESAVTIDTASGGLEIL